MANNGSYDLVIKEIKMLDKQKTNSLKEIQTAMAVVAMTTLFTLWNIFVTTDRRKDDCEQKFMASANDDALENSSLRSLLKDSCFIATGGS